MPDSAHVAQDAAGAKARLAKMVVRIEQELDKTIKMFAFAREALENEMMDGLGYKKQGLHDSFPKKLKELVLGMNSLVETKIKWDKAKKQLGESLTLEEEIEACYQFVLSLTDTQRHDLRDRLNNAGVYKWKS